MLLLDTVTRSGSGVGLSPAVNVPKVSEGRSSDTERTEAMSRSTFTEPAGPGGGGAPAHGCAAEAEFRGTGVPAAKSVALSPVSVQPSSARSAAAVLESPAAEPEPSKSLALP